MLNSNLYLVYFSNTKEENIAAIMEAITSNYVSKRASDNIAMLISNPGDTPESIHTKIISSTGQDVVEGVEVLVCQLTSFYGTLPNSLWEWIEEKIKKNPNMEKINK